PELELEPELQLQEIPLDEPGLASPGAASPAPADNAGEAAEQHYQEGLNQLGLGAAGPAVQHLSRATELAPNHPPYLTTLASALLMERAGGNDRARQGAMACLQRALEIDPHHL